jgi:hypothetical protein
MNITEQTVYCPKQYNTRCSYQQPIKELSTSKTRTCNRHESNVVEISTDRFCQSQKVSVEEQKVGLWFLYLQSNQYKITTDHKVNLHLD